jgi:23S rRNA A2030 N6-methylase RlmJ
MEYSHFRKAGNQGDVWKHAVLLAVADAIEVGERAVYVESHAGAPVHELQAGGEWRKGVGRVTEASACDSAYRAAVVPWVHRNEYPASWVFVANRLAHRAKMVTVELADTSETVAQACKQETALRVPENVRVSFTKSDGFELAIQAVSPSLVFLDPPFSPDRELDWRRLAGTCLRLIEHRVPFLAWYPYSWPTLPNWIVDTTMCETWEVLWAKVGPRQSRNLKGCGMLASSSVASLLHGRNSVLQPLLACLGWEFRVRQPAAQTRFATDGT